MRIIFNVKVSRSMVPYNFSSQMQGNTYMMMVFALVLKITEQTVNWKPKLCITLYHWWVWMTGFTPPVSTYLLYAQERHTRTTFDLCNTTEC